MSAEGTAPRPEVAMGESHMTATRTPRRRRMADRTPAEMLAAVREFADLCARGSGDIPSADVAWKLRGILNSTPDAYAKHGAAVTSPERPVHEEPRG